MDETSFDAADVADAILGTGGSDTTELPVTASSPPTPRQPKSGLGWVLLIALVAAVSVAISLAVQLDDSPPDAPPCGGLYRDCCEQPMPDRDDDTRYDTRDDDRRGLFDAEANFADSDYTNDC